MSNLETYRIRHTDPSGYINWWEGQASSSMEAIGKAKQEKPEFRKEGELYIRVKTHNGAGGWRKPKEMPGD